ncbi:MAG: hypothetical protein NT019_02675 [Candidatus Adlerbacteria bacterium]|nr:hypothetical protein [Candidatus Adlerbacteria bacterium]
MKKLSLASSLLLLAAPLAAFAQFSQQVPGSVQSGSIVALILTAKQIVGLLIPILIAIAVIAFFWGLVKYVWGQGKDTAAGKNTMIAGLASLFVMVTLYGILQFAASALGVSTTQGTLLAPKVETVR